MLLEFDVKPVDGGYQAQFWDWETGRDVFDEDGRLLVGEVGSQYQAKQAAEQLVVKFNTDVLFRQAILEANGVEV